MKTCPNCKKNNDEHNLFCDNCGEVIFLNETELKNSESKLKLKENGAAEDL